jgi:hypothetical protein
MDTIREETPMDATENGHKQTEWTTVYDSVEPHVEVIAGRKFTFTRLPSALQQMRLLDLGAQGQQVGAAGVERLRATLSHMLESDEEALALLDSVASIREVASIITTAMREMMARPTTGRSGSSFGPSETTSTTGYIEPE